MYQNHLFIITAFGYLKPVHVYIPMASSGPTSSNFNYSGEYIRELAFEKTNGRAEMHSAHESSVDLTLLFYTILVTRGGLEK